MVGAELPNIEVVELLVEHWRARCRDFDNYLHATFGMPAPMCIPTRLHLSQMADGSIYPENIGHDFAAVWLIEGLSIQKVPLNFEWQTRWDTDESDTYYLMHSYSFVIEGEELLLSERYGPNLIHRSRGVLAKEQPKSVKWTTCWHSGPEKK